MEFKICFDKYGNPLGHRILWMGRVRWASKAHVTECDAPFFYPRKKLQKKLKISKKM